MKILVVYYSRTNTTKGVAETLARVLPADLEEVVDLKKRQGLIGCLTACRDALLKRLTMVKECRKDPAAYEHVVIGTPVWAGTMTPAIRTYLTWNAGKFKRLSFFATQKLLKRQRVFDDFAKLASRSPFSELQLTASEIKGGDDNYGFEAFVREIKKSLEV